ncbi:MAG: Lrp/AsnC family transcriptional regulator [Candidatus Thorarchaeota archaeon]
MDNIDKAIISELHSNCRISYDELGQKVGLSSSAVWRRVTELEENGVIERYILTLNPSIIRAEFVNAVISLDGVYSEDEIMESLVQHEAIIAATSIINRLCMVSYEANSPSEQESISEYLRSIPGVVAVDIYNIQGFENNERTNIDVEFSADEKEVLQLLIDNPRASINEIVEDIGKPYRKIKKTLEDIMESEKVRFGLQWNPNAKGNEMFILKIDLKKGITLDNICSWLEMEFPKNYWWSFPVVNRGCILSNFIFERIDYAIDAKRRVSDNEMVHSVELFFVVSRFKRARLPERLLRKSICS